LEDESLFRTIPIGNEPAEERGFEFGIVCILETELVANLDHDWRASDLGCKLSHFCKQLNIL
jgi:hypothetical protein